MIQIWANFDTDLVTVKNKLLARYKIITPPDADVGSVGLITYASMVS